MNLVLYSLNDKYFNFEGNPFGAFVQSSEGLFDELKPKPKTQYDWPDQNGLQISTRKPNFLPREITLKGWIEGSDWMDMLFKFNDLFGEFRKSGKQRLTISPFSEIPYEEKTLVYDVLCPEEITLNKTFSEGKMVGFYTLKLIEYNPIKKVLKFEGTELILNFDTVDPIEISIGHHATIEKGSVSLIQNIPPRIIQGDYPGKKGSDNNIHFITLAGDPEEIANLNTNAVIEWERL